MAQATPMNLRYLRAIADIHRESGWLPTVRELGEYVGVSSPATVHSHLSRLRDAGLLESLGTRWRITDRGHDVLEVVR